MAEKGQNEENGHRGKTGCEEGPRPVTVTVLGVQTRCAGDGEDADGEASVRQVWPGTLTRKGDHLFLCYEETDEPGAKTRSTLRIGADSFRLVKTGAVNTRMDFQTGARSVGGYGTPCGRLPFVLDVRKAEVILPKDGSPLEARADYGLEFGGERLFCRIRIRAEENDA